MKNKKKKQTKSEQTTYQSGATAESETRKKKKSHMPLRSLSLDKASAFLSSSQTFVSKTKHKHHKCNNCQYAQVQQSLPSHGRTIVKPNFLATNLVNSLMIAYIILLVVPVSVFAAPKYDTAYACEEKTLTIGCEPGFVINLIRANYGRFSITICNDQGNVDWSVNCMSAKSLRVLFTKCSHKQNCSVLASTNMFGDPCPGTHKYLEAHYQCVSASQATSTTPRSSPPWLITSQPSVWGTSTIRYITTRMPTSESTVNTTLNRNSDPKLDEVTTANRPKIVTKPKLFNGNQTVGSSPNRPSTENASVAAVTKSILNKNEPINSDNTFASSTFSAASKAISANTESNNMDENINSPEHRNNPNKVLIQSTNSINNNPGSAFDETSGLYCGPTTVRNLFWNFTRVGDINVQPCPGGATGIAKWRCSGTLLPNKQRQLNRNLDAGDNGFMEDDSLYSNSNERGYMWQPNTPDLTQCRSLWLNSLEVRVNQRDSALVSISNDLSQVTNSKTLYGGDMLVTTKIIQSLCEKMTYDIETFSDQRQRETVVLELLHSIVKTGSNLLDESQQYSWMDLSFEDQMRVATSLLTGLEDNAFLLADTIAAERNVVQKVKNILLSVRVIETKHIAGNQIFPDSSIESEHMTDDTIELPREALIENSEGGLVRIVFVAFDRLESILHPSNLNEVKSFDNNDIDQSEIPGPTEYAGTGKENLNATQGQPRQRILNSKVISASLGKGRHIQLSQPIRLILKHLQTDNVTNPSCVFWNYIDHAWSEDGCHIEQTNRTHTICMCNHLTNFAILMDVIDDTAQFIQQIGLIDENMRILISISIAICIIFIVIALLTLKLFNGIFIKSNRTTIYKNLYICLLVTEVLIWLGNVQNESSMLCGFTTSFLHCAFLCTVSWIFLEGFQSYITLTTEEILLEVESSSRVISYYLMTYGLSFTIVAISLGIDPSAYTIKADACVWMEQSYLFYVTFVMPCLVYITANFVYVILSANVLRKKCKAVLKNKEKSRLASIRLNLRGSFVFEIIFVACWLCAYFYMVKLHHLYNSAGNYSSLYDTNVQASISFYGYGFVVLNIVQGAFVLCFHCMQNERIRREYQKIVKDSWLPQCLLCNVDTSEDQGPSASPTNNALSGNFLLPTSNVSTKKKSGPETANVAGTFLSGSPIHQSHNQTSTLMRHHHTTQRPNVGVYTGTLRENRSGPMGTMTGVSKYSANTGINMHKHQYQDFQNPELIYPHSAEIQQFHQMPDDGSKMIYYERKMGNSSKTLKSQVTNSTQQMLSSPMKHTCWTGTVDPTSYQLKSRYQHNDDQMHKYSVGGSNSTEFLQTQNYPPTRKNLMQYQMPENISQSPSHSARQVCGPGPGPNDMNNRHSWLSNNYGSRGRQIIAGSESQPYYGDEEPVYEEILGRNENCDDANELRLGKDIDYLHSPTKKPKDGDATTRKKHRIANTNNDGSHTSLGSPSKQQHHLHSRTVQSQQEPKHPLGRNISAMLNENNTVVCYLEPLPNS